MKKTFAVVLAAMMLMAAFAGCGKKAEEPKASTSPAVASEEPAAPSEAPAEAPSEAPAEAPSEAPAESPAASASTAG